MRSRLIYDRDSLVTFRDYTSEALAALDQAVLAAADIPSIVQRDSGGETRGRVWLVIRREHLDEVRELLMDLDPSSASDPPDAP
jgi:hypothetical protein